LSATSLVSSAGAQARESAIAPNEWVTVEVIAKGESVTVKVNGAVVAQYRDERNQFARSGHIALHQDANAVIEFRKVEIDDLSAPRPKDDLPPIDLPKGGAFVPLFNGIDVNGWKVFDNQQNGWRVVDGILIGSGNASSRLHSPRGDYKNFHLRVEARVGDQSAGGVFVRAPFSPFKGYEAKLNATHQHPNKTGSLEAHFPGKPVNLVSVDAPPVPFGAWFTMEVIAQGKRLTVIIDGKTTADYANVDDEYMAGHIALAHFARSTIEFRKIEVKELPAP
jgi:hypothetical protein